MFSGVTLDGHACIPLSKVADHEMVYVWPLPEPIRGSTRRTLPVPSPGGNELDLVLGRRHGEAAVRVHRDIRDLHEVRVEAGNERGAIPERGTVGGARW